MQKQIYSTLNNDVEMPLLGLGVYDMYNAEAEQAVGDALEIGYRLIDTAAMYKNEREVGRAIQASRVPRKDIFLTTKVANTDQGYDETLRAFDASMKKLDCGYIDLYLVHWPIRQTRKDTWRALERLYRQQLVRCIGVSNYLIPFLDELQSYGQIVPVVNQVEFSPYLFLQDLLRLCVERGIQLQAYSPLARGQRMSDPRLVALARQHQKTPAQIMLRWILQHGVSAIPKSVKRERLRENFDVFDFELSAADMQLMDGFHENFRVVDDPMSMW
ncbi:MAG: aldo/keto reductase [Cyclobacteriaceae bacterium]|nr:aldo/keto reductase [Cyclobacteriaceae bacterium]